jgi:butyryl-CoA dehydrogenase
MLFELSEENKLIQETAKDFAQNILSPKAAQIDKEERIPPEVISQLGDLGFWGVIIPEQYGGSGLDTLSLILILEQISYACASTSVTLSVHNSLLCNSLIKYATEEQKKKYLPLLAKGKIIGAFCLTEPEAGSDAASLRTKAQLSGDNYIVNGVKSFITSGDTAGLFVVFVRTNPNVIKSKGISALLVEPNMPGVHIGHGESKMGLHGAPMCEVAFEDARIPKANLLGTENNGFNMAMDLLNCGRIGIAIQSVGIAKAALDLAIKYGKERKQFGKPLTDFQMVSWKLAQIATEIEAGRLLAYQAAIARDKKQPYTKEASMAKLFCSTLANKAVKESLQIHGGWGYTKDFAIERYFRDAKATEIYEGTSEVQLMIISRHLLQ